MPSREFKQLDHNLLREMYEVHKMEVADIASSLGAPYQSVLREIHKAKIQLRPRKGYPMPMANYERRQPGKVAMFRDGVNMKFYLRPAKAGRPMLACINSTYTDDPVTRLRFWRKIEASISDVSAELADRVRAEISAIIPVLSVQELQSMSMVCVKQRKDCNPNRVRTQYPDTGPRLSFTLRNHVAKGQVVIGSIALSATHLYCARCTFWETVERQIAHLSPNEITKIKAEIHVHVPMMTESELEHAANIGLGDYNGSLVLKGDEKRMIDALEKTSMTLEEAETCCAEIDQKHGEIDQKQKFIGFLLLDFKERGGWMAMGFRSLEHCLKARFRSNPMTIVQYRKYINQATFARSIGANIALSDLQTKELQQIPDVETRRRVWQAVVVDDVKVTPAALREFIREIRPDIPPALPPPLAKATLIEMDQNEKGDAVIILKVSGRCAELIIQRDQMAMFKWQS